MNEQSLFDIMLGDTNKWQFLAAFLYALAGAAISALHETTKRKPESTKTPFHFSWNFFWCDNTRRFIRTVLVLLVAVRFSREWLGADITMYLALGYGLMVDKLSEQLKYLRRDREEAKTTSSNKDL